MKKSTCITAPFVKRFVCALCFILLLSKGVFAQNYSPLISGTTSYYRVVSNGYIWPAYIRDSISTTMGTEYLLHQNIQKNDNNYGCDLNLNTGWMGKSYMQYKDSILFLNGAEEPVLLRLNTHKGEQWISYKDTAYTLILHHTTDTVDIVLGELDSVKVFTITLLDKQQQVLSDHFLNNEKVKLSKQHGFLRIYNLYNMLKYAEETDINYTAGQIYELVGNSSITQGIKNMSMYDIYDFEIGDEFHIKNYHFNSSYPNNYSSDTSWIIKKVIAKTIFDDSIVYTYLRRIYTIKKESINAVWQKSVVYDTVKQAVMPDIAFDSDPGEITPTAYNQFKLYVMGIEDNGHLFKYEALACYLGNSDSCLQILFDCSLPHYKYYKGLGGAYYEYDNPNQVLYSNTSGNKLEYYKKGNTSWGTPFTQNLGIKEYATSQIELYPNPTSGSLFINNPQHEKGILKVLNIQGKIVVQYDVNTESFMPITLLDMENGMHIYVLETNEGTVLKGKLFIIR